MDDDNPLVCSFCGCRKEDSYNAIFITGPKGVNLCDICVMEAVRIIYRLRVENQNKYWTCNHIETSWISHDNIHDFYELVDSGYDWADMREDGWGKTDIWSVIMDGR
jgi:hypothetical protein